jgi:hypothetical protein
VFEQLVEQVIVEDGAFTCTGGFHIEYQVRNGVFSRANVVLPDPVKYCCQFPSSSSYRPLFHRSSDFFDKVAEAVDASLSSLENSLKHGCHFLNGNLVHSVLEVGIGVALKPRVIRDGGIGGGSLI